MHDLSTCPRLLAPQVKSANIDATQPRRDGVTRMKYGDKQTTRCVRALLIDSSGCDSRQIKKLPQHPSRYYSGYRIRREEQILPALIFTVEEGMCDVLLLGE